MSGRLRGREGAQARRLKQDGRVSTIWLRRVLAVLVGLAFAGALATFLLLQAASSTVARPGFYTDRIAEADTYRFITTDLADAFIEDARGLDAEEFDEDFTDNPIESSGLTTSQIADALRRALPPDELEAIAAPALEEVVEYLAGERDSVTVDIALGPHVEAAVDELTTLMRESGSYELLLERELAPIFEEWASEALPPDEQEAGWVTFLGGSSGNTRNSLVRVFTRVVTPEWLAQQAEDGASEVTSYVVGSSDGFELRAALDDAQAAAAADEIEAILGEADAYEVAHSTVIGPAVEEQVDAVVQLPYGVEVTREEVLAAVREAMPPEWVEQQTAVLTAGVASYLTGQSDTFTFEIDVPKDMAAVALTGAATSSLGDALERLPPCATGADSATALAALQRQLPDCMPPDLGVREALEEATPVIRDAIDRSVMARVPDTVTYTERDLRAALERDAGPDALVAIDDVRALFTTDWTYTDEDLRADLSGDEAAALDDVRSVLGDGLTLELVTEDREGLEEAMEAVREVADGVRSGRWVALVVAVALLGTVGAVGGTSWRAGVAWAGATLLVSALPMALLAGPVYQSASAAVFDALRDEIVIDPDTALLLTSELLTDKLLDIAQGSADDIAGGIFRNSLLLAVLGAVALAVSLSWERIARATGRGQS